MKSITPEQMTVICNIQTMRQRIYDPDYNWIEDKERLYTKTLKELHEEQENLIPLWNEAINKTYELLKSNRKKTAL